MVVKPPYRSVADAEARELVCYVRFKRTVGEAIGDQQIGDTLPLAIFNERDWTAFGPATLGCDHAHHKLAGNVQAHIKRPY
jgi:hypothetical protein